jgi:hypothetical protein
MQTKKPITEVEALTKVTRILSQLTPEQRKRCLEFLASAEGK